MGSKPANGRILHPVCWNTKFQQQMSSGKWKLSISMMMGDLFFILSTEVQVSTLGLGEKVFSFLTALALFFFSKQEHIFKVFTLGGKVFSILGILTVCV